MDNIFKVGLELVAHKKYNEALDYYNSINKISSLPDSIKEQINFNISFLRKKLKQSFKISNNKNIKIGIIVPLKLQSGLYRDAETIEWALENDPDISCSFLFNDTNIYSHDYKINLNKKYRSSTFARLDDSSKFTSIDNWLNGLDALIILEALNLSIVSLAKMKKNISQVFFIPNLEWSVIDNKSDDIKPWVDFLHKSNRFIVTISRAQSIYKQLLEIGINSVLVPWSIPDKIFSPIRPSLSSGRPLNILFNGGNLGFRNRRGLDIVVDAMHRMDTSQRPVNILIKSNLDNGIFKSLPKNYGLKIEVDTRFLSSREDLLQYYDNADLVLYPSRFEGFGLSLLEALHRGCYVLATDGEPMIDIIPPYFMRIASKKVGTTRLAPTYEPSAQSLVDCIHKILHNPSLLNFNNEWIYNKRQTNFKRNLIGLVKALT